MKVSIRNRQRLLRINLRRLRRDSLRLLKEFNLQRSEVGILLVNDKRMKTLNLHYRKVARTTDVISFPIYRNVKEIPHERENLLGDIVINLSAAERQSLLYRSSFYGEVRRLHVHGFLHLLGYNHEMSIYRKRKMEKMERELQGALASMD